MVSMRSEQTGLKTKFRDDVEKNRRMIEIETINSRTLMNTKVPNLNGKIPWSIYLIQLEAASVVNEWNEKDDTMLVLVPSGEPLDVPYSASEDKTTLTCFAT